MHIKLAGRHEMRGRERTRDERTPEARDTDTHQIYIA
jgi:hypothetical protein